MRQRYGFSEYALHEYAKTARVSWIADHLDAVLAQTLATRAYRALNRVCVGEARRVRFKSRGRGLGSLENKRNDTGLRFVLQKPEEGHRGFLIWKDDQLEAVIDWEDEVVAHGLRQRIKYARLVAASVPRGRMHEGFAMQCNSRWKESLIARRNTPWATTSSERTWDPRRSRWSREQARRVFRSSVRN